jgi:hypothetical protein
MEDPIKDLDLDALMPPAVRARLMAQSIMRPSSQEDWEEQAGYQAWCEQMDIDAGK